MTNQGCYALNQLWVTSILHNFRLVLDGKARKEIPESSSLELVEIFLASNFASSNPEDTTSGPLYRERKADLPLLRTLSDIA